MKHFRKNLLIEMSFKVRKLAAQKWFKQ